jgi:hypothetical protein
MYIDLLANPIKAFENLQKNLQIDPEILNQVAIFVKNR